MKCEAMLSVDPCFQCRNPAIRGSYCGLHDTSRPKRTDRLSAAREGVVSALERAIFGPEEFKWAATLENRTPHDGSPTIIKCRACERVITYGNEKVPGHTKECWVPPACAALKELEEASK